MPQQLLVLGKASESSESLSYDERVASIIGEACRLAMLLMLAPVWRHYEVTHSHTIPLIRKQQQSFHQHLDLWRTTTEVWLLDLLLWISCVSAIETISWAESANTAEGDAEATLLLQRSVIVVRSIATSADINLQQQADVEAALKRVLWVDSILDRGVQRLISLLQTAK